MREIGIVNWYGGFNVHKGKYNDYGYIFRKNGEEIYVNRNHLRCKGELLKPRTLVTFELGLNFKNNKKQALKVKILKTEKDKELIENCINEEKTIEESNLPKDINFNKELFKILNEKEKVEFMYKLDEVKFYEYWEVTDRKTKILFISKCAKENIQFDSLEKINEKDKIIRYCLIILWAKFNQDKKEVAFKKAQELMERYLKELKEKEELTPLLKKCFHDKERYCDYIKMNIKADCSLDYFEWSLLELLSSSNIVLTVDGRDETDKYMLSLGRYVNNLK